jgi:hypothetical protein
MFINFNLKFKFSVFNITEKLKIENIVVKQFLHS